jgi:hypothetical protein
MREPGVEPGCLAAQDPKSCASASSATLAKHRRLDGDTNLDNSPSSARFGRVIRGRGLLQRAPSEWARVQYRRQIQELPSALRVKTLALDGSLSSARIERDNSRDSTMHVMGRCTRVVVLTAACLALPHVVSMAQALPKFAGTWRLVSYDSRDSAGTVEYPWGKDAIGRLMYDSRGNMSASLMKPGRPRFASQDLRSGTDAEVRAAYEGFISYWGTYTVDSAKRTVAHHVLGASYPNWVGVDQLRYFRLDGQRLVLTTPPLRIDGRLLTSVLVWERVP